MKKPRTVISICLIALGLYIIAVEQAFVQKSLREAWYLLSEESKNSPVGNLLWTSRGVHNLFVLGSLVWILASFRLCLDLIAWRKGNSRVIVATMFLIAYIAVNSFAIIIPWIPGAFAMCFGMIPIFPASAIIATWVFFRRSKAHLERWKLAGIVFTACFLFLGGYSALALAAIYGTI